MERFIDYTPANTGPKCEPRQRAAMSPNAANPVIVVPYDEISIRGGFGESMVCLVVQRADGKEARAWVRAMDNGHGQITFAMLVRRGEDRETTRTATGTFRDYGSGSVANV